MILRSHLIVAAPYLPVQVPYVSTKKTTTEHIVQHTGATHSESTKGGIEKKVGARGNKKRKRTFWQRCTVLLSPTTTHIGRHTGATISENTTAEREGGGKEGKGTKKTMVSSRAKSWRTAVEHTDNLSAFF